MTHPNTTQTMIRPLLFSSWKYPLKQFAKHFKNDQDLKDFFSPFNFLLCFTMTSVASIAIGIFYASISSGLSFFTVGLMFSCCFIEGNFLDQQTYNQILQQVKENQKNEPPRQLGQQRRFEFDSNANPQQAKATHPPTNSGNLNHAPTGP